MQGEPVNVPPLLLKLTVPVGAVAPDDAVSVTTAVQVVAWLMTTLEGEHVTAVVVGFLPTARENVPELPA